MEGLRSRAWKIARSLGSRLACLCASLPLPLPLSPPLSGSRAQRTSTTHYPAWLMHQSGKFDSVAEKGGRRGA